MDSGELLLDDVLVDDDIQEEEKDTKDVRDHHSKERITTLQSGLNNCSHFLKFCCAKEKINCMRLEDIPFEGINGKGNAFWDKMIASFMHHLGSAAKLQWNSASKHASNVKTFLVDKFRTEERISALRDEQWRVLRRQLLSMHAKECKKTGRKLVNGQEGSTDDDRIAIGTACIWIGDAKSAQFLVLEAAKCCASGRCREISRSEVEDICIKNVNEDGRSCRALGLKVDRDKQNGLQTVMLCPHQHCMQQDVCFALICNLLVTRFVETYLFNDFAIRREENLQGKTKSTVSQLWSTRFKSLFKQFSELAEIVNLKLKSHDGKAGCQQKLVENPLTAGFPQVFHSGWELSAAHALFEHVKPPESMARQTGKALANWSASVDGRIIGGSPPSIKGIRGEENLKMARALCACLFRDDRDSCWSPAICEILFASFLRFCPELVKLLEQHPKGKHGNLKSHPATRVTLQGLDDLGIDHCRLNDWCVDVRKGFLQRNTEALPLPMLTNNGFDGSDEMQVDARSFLSQINALTRACMAVSNRMGSIEENQRLVLDRQDRLEKKMDRVIELLESRTRNREEESERFVHSEAVAEHKPSAPAKLFTRFFADSLHVLHHAQLKTKAWRCLNQKDRRKVSTDFRRKKKCVRHMLCFCDDFPSRPPKLGCTDWLTNLTRNAGNAERRLLDHWNRKSGKPHSKKLKFCMIEDVTFDDLDDSFSRMEPKGMTLADLEMLKASKD